MDEIRFQRVAEAIREELSELISYEMTDPRVAEIARTNLCPEFWTAQQYRESLEATGLQILHQQDLTQRVLHTWEICLDRVRLAGPAILLLPNAAREFVDGIAGLLEGYRQGYFTYTVFAAQKPE